MLPRDRHLRFLGQAEAAAPWIEGCLAADPPADVRELVQPVSDEIVAVLAGTGIPPTTSP